MDEINKIHELLTACHTGDLEKVKELINTKIDINKIGYDNNYTPLMAGCFNEQFNVVKYLVESGADVNKLDFINRNALFFCKTNKKTNIIEYLMEKGISINQKDSLGKTALKEFIGTGNIFTIKFLLEKGVKIDPDDDILIYYIRYNNSRSGYSNPIDTDIFKLLVENGADVNLRDKDNNSILYYFCEKINDYNLFEFLFANGLKIQNNDDILMHYIGYNTNISIDIFNIMVENGANVNLKDRNKRNILYYIVSYTSDDYDFMHETFDYLISKGVNVNCRDTDSNNVLLFLIKTYKNKTVTRQIISIIELLIQAKIDYKLCDKDGKNALSLAKEYAEENKKFSKIVEYLSEIMEMDLPIVDISFKDDNDTQEQKENKKEPEVLDILKKSNYKCFFGVNHSSFTSKKNNNPYMLIHNIIPLSNKKSFKNIDLESIEFQICICPLCKSKLENAIMKEKQDMLNKMHSQIKDELSIKFEDFAKMYE